MNDKTKATTKILGWLLFALVLCLTSHWFFPEGIREVVILLVGGAVALCITEVIEDYQDKERQREQKLASNQRE